MAQKTYNVEALLAILSDHAIAAHEEAYTWHVDSDPGAEPLVRYLIDENGVWLSFLDGLTEREVKGLTGYETSQLKKLGLTQSGERVWGLKDGSALLPLPFTLAQLQQFEENSGGMCAERIWCGEETDALIESLAERNPDAAEIARALVSGQLSPGGGTARAGSPRAWMTRNGLLHCWKELGGTFDREGKPKGPRGAFKALAAKDGRKRSSVTAALKKAQSQSEADRGGLSGMAQRLRIGR